MTVKTLFIGDPHFQLNNFTDIDIFVNEIKNMCNK